MNDRIKDTFDKIYAEAELKDHTKEFIAYKTRNYKSWRINLYRQTAPVMACLLFMMFSFGGYRLFFTNTAMISIDINPSIELNINRFDRVISVDSYNDDGSKLANTLDIQFMDYRSALDTILNTESITIYLSQDETLSISVAGRSQQKSEEMLANIETCIPSQQNIFCYMGNIEDVNAAHAAGLSLGKYRAYTELQKVNPQITIEDVKGLTMRQIRDLISRSAEDENVENNGNGNQHRHRHGQE